MVDTRLRRLHMDLRFHAEVLSVWLKAVPAEQNVVVTVREFPSHLQE